MNGHAVVLRGDARHLPLPDASVDLIVTSPPYFGLRSYSDEGYCAECRIMREQGRDPRQAWPDYDAHWQEVHAPRPYDGQIGSEATPREWLAAMLECTAEWVRVLKPSGSIFVNLGDSFSSGQSFDNAMTVGDAGWLAGLIDADGTITVRRAQQPQMRALSFEGIIAVEQEDKQAVERAHAITGRGHIATITGSRGKPMYRWTVSTQQARWVAERIWPWLRIKQRQALAIVELGRHREKHSARGRWNPIRPEWVTYRARICQAVRAWNQREPDDWEPPQLPVIELPLQPRFVPPKSLFGLPWRYALACTDELGLYLRRDIIFSKPNGLPESVTDRCRSSHEYLFHLVKQPRYYAAVDEIREQYDRFRPGGVANGTHKIADARLSVNVDYGGTRPGQNPLGKLPGSVWDIPEGEPTVRVILRAMAAGAIAIGEAERLLTPEPQDDDPSDVWAIPSQPLTVPAWLGIDHFACVDTETEILTRRGWLRHDALRDDDEVAGCDLDTGLTRWAGLHGIHRYDYDGELVTAEARGLSMRLTPNHRALAHRHAGRHRFRQPVEVITADALTAQHSIPRAVEWAEDGREKSIGADLAALLGWVAAEGWYSADRRRVYLSQSLTVNAAKVESIAALLGRLGDDPLRTERDREWRGRPWRDVQWRLGRTLATEVLRLMPGKLLPASLADLPLAEARALLDAFVDGDGHRRPDGRVGVFQQVRHNLDVLQSVAVRLGYNTTLRENGGRWVLYLNPPRPARLRRSDGTSLVGREHYRGTVWCVTTGTGTFVARRNGSVFVTGNSFPMELPRRVILGWSPPGICTVCNEGRRPVASVANVEDRKGRKQRIVDYSLDAAHGPDGRGGERWRQTVAITGYVCACTPYTDHPGTGSSGEGYNRPGEGIDAGRRISFPETPSRLSTRPKVGGGREYHQDWAPPPTRPAVVVDPFSGTGTTMLTASVLGRIGIGTDLSADYCRLARWRVRDPAERAKALQVPKPPPVPDGQGDLFDLTAGT